ncbi:winged helix-turn-helix transcriptional regulator [Trichlorobacter ammonificans]|uniref:Winged helix-turn-helix DNA-binding n=1 Tax=Trichlorobacter ammonificans TaxID=2916410 RepID=A0ABN8HKB8_9BACT|nr:winged helix-turn-helix transcriptional regulator [Trichlorobacter ammonificans]CAH2032037.1 Winged helix-turn-helix DNA-binding [Trichlorobacter ammonificans]
MNEKSTGSLDTYTIFRLLCTLAADGSLSQRDLARRLGCALGLVNAYLKTAATKGWIKARELGGNRSAYQVTAKGNNELRRLALQHARNLDDLFSIVADEYQRAIQPLHDEGVERVALCGLDGVSIIPWQALQEAGIDVTVVMDSQGIGRRFMGKEVVSLAHALLGGRYRVVIGSLNRAEQLHQALCDLGVDADTIVVPPSFLGKRS